MLLGCIADDFTGASDIANTLAQGGMETIQFMGRLRSSNVPTCEAGVVALKTRSVPAENAVRQSLEALEWLRSQGCHQFVFKYCSTFDSTIEGNIGPVSEALLAALDAPIAVVCPAFPATGRTMYKGHLFVKERLLSESGMEHHPLNPMADPDIRRWLGHQTTCDVGLIPYTVVRAGAEAISAAIDIEATAKRPLVVVDAIVKEDLLTIGKAVADHRLVTGGSGVALGLPENFRCSGLLADANSDFEPLIGPGVVLSGSCSTISNAQVTEHLKIHPGFVVSAYELMDGRLSVDDAFNFFRSNIGKNPIIYSTAPPTSTKAVQERYGRSAAAARIECFFADLATKLVSDGVTRLVVGGGETSGAVVSALGLEYMRVGPEIDPGVPALATDRPAPLRMALKSGNFGSVEFYSKALQELGENGRRA